MNNPICYENPNQFLPLGTQRQAVEPKQVFVQELLLVLEKLGWPKPLDGRQIMKNRVEKTDAIIKADVLAELEYEPKVKATDIGVLVKDGTLTLTGHVRSYNEKWSALHAARRVAGVNAIADEIEVKLPASILVTDGEIAAAAAQQIAWFPMIVTNSIQVTVSKGWVTLEGEVEWWNQKNDAEVLVHHLVGVRGVSNLITIHSQLTGAEVQKSIQSAFERNAIVDDGEIRVETLGNRVVLHGKVRNHSQRQEAERVAWAAPGVSVVDNQLSVRWQWFRT